MFPSPLVKIISDLSGYGKVTWSKDGNKFFVRVTLDEPDKSGHLVDRMAKYFNAAGISFSTGIVKNTFHLSWELK